jgi:hypothetical protein
MDPEAVAAQDRNARQDRIAGPDEVILRCKACETLYTDPSGWCGAIALNICGKCGLCDYILDAITNRILKTRPDPAIPAEGGEPCTVS